MSSCFAYGLATGKPLGEITKVALEASGGSLLWQNLPVLVVVLWGGFTTNFIWCLILNIRNRSSHEYLNMRPSHISEMSAAEGMMISSAPEIAANREATAHGASRYEGPAPLSCENISSAPSRADLVSAVFLLQHGVDENGHLHLIQLDPPHGVDHHFQHDFGNFPS